MKKVLIVLLLLTLSLVGFVSAGSCSLQLSLLSQDPYPAVPGEYVKLVLQVSGAENPSCGEMVFTLPEQYPISFDSNSSPEVRVQGGTFVYDYQNALLIPYRVRVDENAIDGDNPLKIYYKLDSVSNNSVLLSNSITLNVKNVKTNFEAYVKNFDFTTNILTIQILNSGKSNIDALTIEIPEQKNVTVKGSNRNIVGSLDANEYTTTDFEVTPVESDMLLNLFYTDKIGVRRHTNTTIHFDPTYFEGRKSQQKSSSTWIWVLVIIVLVVVYIFYRRYQNNKKKKLHS